jgi:hypothetical protein
MGGSISITSKTNEMVNEQMTKAMTTSFSSCDMSSNQSQDAIIYGNKNADITVDQNMLLKVLSTCEITTEITNEIKNNIDTFLKDKMDIETGAPLVGLNYTSTEFLNKIRNTIKTELTVNTVSKIIQSVKASQNALVADNNGGTIKVTQQMTGDIILKALITNKVINNALNELKNQLEIDNSIKNKGFDWDSFLNIIIAICVLIVCWYVVPIITGAFSKKNNNNDDRYYNRYDNRYDDRYDGYRR